MDLPKLFLLEQVSGLEAIETMSPNDNIGWMSVDRQGPEVLLEVQPLAFSYSMLLSTVWIKI